MQLMESWMLFQRESFIYKKDRLNWEGTINSDWCYLLNKQRKSDEKRCEGCLWECHLHLTPNQLLSC